MSEHRFDLERNLAEVIARLNRRFDHIDPAVVEATVRRCAEEFTGARIDRFVSILVERRSAEQLKAVAATTTAASDDHAAAS